MAAHVDLLLRLTTSVATLAIAFYVARISRHQWLTNQEKLRLDLYDRRFTIYVCVLDFYQELLAWDGTPEQIQLGIPFLKAVRESRFLFPEKSGVHEILKELQTHAFFIRTFEDSKRAYLHMPKELIEHTQRRLEHVNWILNSMERIEDKMAPLLNFHAL